jgi:hypothetical protein
MPAWRDSFRFLAAAMRRRAPALGLLALLAACGTPDYTAVRDWAGTASRAADYPVLTASCALHESQAAPLPVPWVEGTRAMQSVLSIYLGALGIMAADGTIPYREDPFVREAALAARLDEAGGRAVTGLGAFMRYATRSNARAPQLGASVTTADAHVQPLAAALITAVGSAAPPAAQDRATIAAGYAGLAAEARDLATRRALQDIAALRDADLAAREAARGTYVRILRQIAEGHALLKERAGGLSQEETARLLRNAEDSLRRAAELLPRALGMPLAGGPCAEPAPTPPAGSP